MDVVRKSLTDRLSINRVNSAFKKRKRTEEGGAVAWINGKPHERGADFPDCDGANKKMKKGQLAVGAPPQVNILNKRTSSNAGINHLSSNSSTNHTLVSHPATTNKPHRLSYNNMTNNNKCLPVYSSNRLSCNNQSGITRSSTVAVKAKETESTWRIYPYKTIKKWEQVTGKRWVYLNNEERKEANRQMKDIV